MVIIEIASKLISQNAINPRIPRAIDPIVSAISNAHNGWGIISREIGIITTEVKWKNCL